MFDMHKLGRCLRFLVLILLFYQLCCIFLPATASSSPSSTLPPKFLFRPFHGRRVIDRNSAHNDDEVTFELFSQHSKRDDSSYYDVDPLIKSYNVSENEEDEEEDFARNENRLEGSKRKSYGRNLNHFNENLNASKPQSSVVYEDESEENNKTTSFDPLSYILMTLLSKRNSSESSPANHTHSANSTRNVPEDSDLIGESRTLSSWLGLRRKSTKPSRKDRPYYPHAQRFIPHQLPPVALPPLFPNFLPHPEGFPSPFDPNSVLLPPALLEDSGIEYWLKFIENGGKLPATRPKYRPLALSNSRRKKPSHHASLISKPKGTINIGEKPHSEHLYEEDELNENEPPEQPNMSNHGHGSSQPSQFDTSPRCDKFTTDICVDDFEYPEQAIVDEIYKRKELFELMYSEVRDNVPLVDGIPRDVEEAYNYDHYYSPNGEEIQDEFASSGTDYATGDKALPGGFICPSEVLYGKPKLARNRKGAWKVIVNAGEFTQTVRMEKCIKPNGKCNYISYPEYNSRCAQVHSFHRLMVFEKGKGFYIDTFRIPTACTCHVNRRTNVFKASQYQGQGMGHDMEDSHHYETRHKNHNHNNKHPNHKPFHGGNSNQPALSNTLWSILGGGSPSTIGTGQIPTAQHEMLRTQLSVLEQLKRQYPQIAAQISPDNVLQQLMDVQNASPKPTTGYSSTLQHSSQFGLNNHATIAQPHNSQLVPLQTPSQSVEYLIPSILYEGNPTANSKNRNNRPTALSQVSHHPPPSSTTTLLNPGGAPVVQVIHVPVTSNVPSQPAAAYKTQQSPQQQYSGLGYLDAGNLLNGLKNKKRPLIYSTGQSVRGYRPALLQLSSKSNSSLLAPDIIGEITYESGQQHHDNDNQNDNEEEINDEEDEELISMTSKPMSYHAENDEEDSDADEHNSQNSQRRNHQPATDSSNSTLNKRINFSYHPILEYISN